MLFYAYCKTVFQKHALTCTSHGCEESSIKYEVLVKDKLSTFWFLVNRKEAVLYHGHAIGSNLYVSM